MEPLTHSHTHTLTHCAQQQYNSSQPAVTLLHPLYQPRVLCGRSTPPSLSSRGTNHQQEMEISGDVYNSLKHFNNHASNINTCIVWLIGYDLFFSSSHSPPSLTLVSQSSPPLPSLSLTIDSTHPRHPHQ